MLIRNSRWSEHNQLIDIYSGSIPASNQHSGEDCRVHASKAVTGNCHLIAGIYELFQFQECIYHSFISALVNDTKNGNIERNSIKIAKPIFCILGTGKRKDDRAAIINHATSDSTSSAY